MSSDDGAGYSERNPRVWVGPSYRSDGRGEPDRYHTTPTCRRVTDDYVELDRDDLDGNFSVCLYCSGELSSPDDRRTPLIDRVDRGEIDTASASKAWWKL